MKLIAAILGIGVVALLVKAARPANTQGRSLRRRMSLNEAVCTGLLKTK